MTDAAPSSRFSPRTIKYALMASLALNVLVIGGIIGSLCFSHGPRHHGPKSPLLGFARTLPSERGDIIRQKYADTQSEMEKLRQAERRARAEARDLLTAEPFDAQKFKAALDDAAAAEGQLKSARMRVFAESAGELTPDERKQLHEWLEKRRPPR